MSMETIKTEYQSELALVEDAKQLSDFWAKYLGKGGQVQKLMEGIKNVPNEEKKAYGQSVNQIKNWVQELYDQKKEEVDKKSLLAQHDVYSIGRYGSWTYCSIEDGMLEAKALLNKKQR